MSSERYVVCGLARPRAGWFTELARWATSGALPIEFAKCLTVEETRARLTDGRRWSALVLDGSIPQLDRDLLELASAAGAAVVVIDDDRVERNWTQLGATVVLPHDADHERVIASLAEHARPVARLTPRPETPSAVATSPWRGRLIAVTGTGGTGSSTVAAMAAQAFGSEVTSHGMVLLADLSLDADQAVLHDTGDVIPGLPELVDAHRLGHPDAEEVRRLTFDAGVRQHHLLLGLRRHRDWTSLRSRSVIAAIDGLRRAYRTVIADVDPDVEGEADTGSIDVEERNLLARHTLLTADVVVVVGGPGVVEVHQLARLLRRLVAAGVEAQRLLPLVNRGPRSAPKRSEIARAVSDLAGVECHQTPTPITIPFRRRLEEVVRTGGRWPDAMAGPIRSGVEALLERVPLGDDQPSTFAAPVAITPGTLGHYSDLAGIEEDLA